MRKLFTTFVVLILAFTCASVFAQVRNEAQTNRNKEKLLKLADKYHQEHLLKRAEVERVAQEKGWDIRVETDEALWEIQYIDDYGMPQSYITCNLNAARTTNTDDLWTGGSSGLNLDGTGYLIGEWDGGGVLTTHQEFDGRVTQMDGAATTSYHSTHVAGTLIAEGQVGAAKGMAHEGLLNAYEWTDDISEMTTAAANGLTLSNHSYSWSRGWTWRSDVGEYYWYGNTSISTTEDYLFGFYDETSEDIDNIAVNAPHYLPVWAASNDRNDDWNGGHYVWGGTSWVWSTASRDPDGGSNGYDCLPQNAVAKNVLTIGAVNDITGGWTSPSDVVMSTFSSWGPTDDGRIKPDIVANGVNLYSTDDDFTSDYRYLDGTSMAAPNTTGTLALLQDYFQDLRGGTMMSSSIKGLAINTANEAGTANGPDYEFGWGLLNATGAADLITVDALEGGLIVEGVILDGETIDYTYYSDGTEDIRVTLCWIDPPGTPPAASLNPSTIMLKHDLDVYVINESSTYFYPWRLNPASPSAAATNTSYNYRDNVERVDIYSPAAGYYTIRVDEFSVLPAEGQTYSLIIQGLETEPSLVTYCTGSPPRALYNFEYIKNVTMGDINNTSGLSPGGYENYTGLIDVVSQGGNKPISVTVENYYSPDYVYVWCDWDQDGNFEISEQYNLGDGAIVSGTISVPTGASLGYTTMRVRMTYSSTPTACGTQGYTEAEDYTIYVGARGLWTGAVSSSWSNPGNWDDNMVPTSTVDVTIPSGCPNYPVLTGSLGINTASYTYDCNSLTIHSGASVTVDGNPVYTYGDLTVAGSLSIGDDFFLYSGSTTNLSGTIQIGNTNGWHGQAYHTSGSVFNQTGGNYYIEQISLSNGCQFNGDAGYVRVYVHDFASNNYIDIDDPDSYFYRFVVEASASAALNTCTYDLEATQSVVTYGPLAVNSFSINTTYMDIYALFSITSGGIVNVTGNGPYIHSGGSIAMTTGSEFNCGTNMWFQVGSTENISGGEIFVGGTFTDSDLIFSPAGGSVTFDGATTASIIGPTTFFNLNINKTISDKSSGQFDEIFNSNDISFDDSDVSSSGPLSSDYKPGESKATLVNLGSTVTVNGNLVITAGELRLNGNELNVGNDCDVYGILTMDNPADILNVGTATGFGWLEIMSGGTANLAEGTVYIPRWLVPRSGCNFTASTNNTIIFIGNTGGGPSNQEPTATYGNIIINKNPAQTTYVDGGATEPIIINGNCTVNPDNTFDVQDNTMIVYGLLSDNSTSTIKTYYGTKDGSVEKGNSSTGSTSGEAKGGYFEIDSDFLLTGLLDVGDGDVLIHGNFDEAASGSLIINGGSLISDAPTASISYYAGTFDMADGLLEITNNPMNFYPSSSTIGGGTIRCGGSFISNQSGTIQPTGGSVELIGAGSTGQYIQLHADNYFHNLTINRTNAIQIYTGHELDIRNDFTISNGGLNSNGMNIYLGGNWINNVGVSGFSATTAAVIFNQDGGIQYVHGENTFNNVQQDLVGAGSNLQFMDPNTVLGDMTLNHFAWINDLFDVQGTLNLNNPASKFTANGGGIGTIALLDQGGTVVANSGDIYFLDVVEAGIFGNVNITSLGGTLDYLQDPSQFPDINADITIESGVLNVSGGSGGNVWGFSTPASITMSDGEFNLSGNNVSINDGSFTENITGGLMTFNMGFNASSAAFTPTGGTVRMVGGTDGSLGMTAGANFFNVEINKFGGDKSVFVYKDRNGNVIESTKSDIAYLSTDLEIEGELIVEEGTLSLNANTLNCYGDININDGGILNVNENSTLALDNAYLHANSGGTLEMLGSAGNEATITMVASTMYGLWIENGGTISAEHALFEYMTYVYLMVGSSVDPIHSFHNCTFQNGMAGGNLMVIYNTQDFQVNNAVFPTNTWGGAYNVRNTSLGHVTFHNASGGFAGPEYENDDYNTIHWTSDPYQVDLEIFMQGPFDPSTTKMETDLNGFGLIPTSQPFDSNPLADWYYTGPENVGSIPSFVVDWVLVELRDASNVGSALPSRAIAQQAGFVLNNGQVVGLDGLNPLDFNAAVFNNLYVTVWHRNHLGVISANPLVNVAGTYSYSFITAAGQAYGGTSAQVELNPGIWGILSGDANGSGNITSHDIDNYWDNEAGEAGYKVSDFNLDSQVNNQDKNDYWVPNLGADSFIPE